MGPFYCKSNFAKWGVQPPKTWAEFMTLCQTLKGKGIPIGIGLGDTPWVASAWFDYLNIRINGGRSTANCSPASTASTTPR